MISIGYWSPSLSLSFWVGFSSLVFGDWGYIRSCEILAGVDLIVSDHCIFSERFFFWSSWRKWGFWVSVEINGFARDCCLSFLIFRF
jgi:hypothetical protein